MISKTLMGVNFFDDHFGGVYSGRSVLISGRKGVGKTVVGLQFLRQGLQMDERCMMLSTMSSKDFAIYSESLGFDMQQELENGSLVLLEYRDFVPEYGFSEGNMLPPDGFDQLRSIIESNMIQRVVIDTVLPLVAIRTLERMNEHVFSFVRFLDRLNVTALMTIPKPVSPIALRLKKTLEEQVTVSCILAPGDKEGVFTWQTVKYFGERKLVSPISYTVCPGKGPVVYNPAATSTQGASNAPPASHVALARPMPPGADKSSWAGSAAASAPESHDLPNDMSSAYHAGGWAPVKHPAPPEPEPPPPPPPQPQSQAPASAQALSAKPALPRPANSSGPNAQLRFSAVWSPKKVADVDAGAKKQSSNSSQS